MSALTRSNLTSQRSARRERVDAKHHPEAVFVPTEDQALVIDLARNEVKGTPAYFDLSLSFALEQQNGGAL